MSEPASRFAGFDRSAMQFWHELASEMVPVGFAADHPRAELLKLKGLTAGPPEIPVGLLHEPGLAAWLARHGKALAPLVNLAASPRRLG